MLASRFPVIPAATILLSSTSVPVWAQDDADIAALQEELQSLQELQSNLNARISAVESRLSSFDSSPAKNAVIATASGQRHEQAASVSQVAAAAEDRLTLGGDFRVRYEGNFSNGANTNRSRGVIRARLRARYQINDNFAVGSQLSTGDPDDPNSADVTLSNFADDLTVSLDQAYINAKFGNAAIFAGKIPQPFRATDRIWDGDVSPQGVSASYELIRNDATSLKAHSLLFLIDEQSVGQDSAMLGGQFELKHKWTSDFQTEFAVGYYDYRLHSTNGADFGDIRTNQYVAGAYVSDFDILHLIASVRWDRWERWPIELRGDFSHNFGAVDVQNASADNAFGIDVMAGQLTNRGDARLSYGYAQSDVDSTLAAYAQDNIEFGTNYMFHSVAFDYALSSHFFLNTSLYRYRAKDMQFAPIGQTSDWRHRLRLNLVAKF